MTITRAFGFTLDTQTGIVKRWAHERVTLPAARDAGGDVAVCQRPCRCGPDGRADSICTGVTR